MPEPDESVAMMDHSAHSSGEAATHRQSRVRWTITYVIALILVAVALFVLVPGGGQLSLLVVFGGLMLLMHMPGGLHQHGG